MNKADSEQAVQAEEVRQAAVVPLLELRNTVLAKKKQHECTGAWFTETICSFLFTEAGIENAVLSGDDSCRTLWDILVGIFEAMHSALGKLRYLRRSTTRCSAISALKQLWLDLRR